MKQGGKTPSRLITEFSSAAGEKCDPFIMSFTPDGKYDFQKASAAQV